MNRPYRPADLDNHAVESARAAFLNLYRLHRPELMLKLRDRALPVALIERATTNFACSIVRHTELMVWPGYWSLTLISSLSEITLSPPNSTLSALTTYSKVISG